MIDPVSPGAYLMEVGQAPLPTSAKEISCFVVVALFVVVSLVLVSGCAVVVAPSESASGGKPCSAPNLFGKGWKRGHVENACPVESTENGYGQRV